MTKSLLFTMLASTACVAASAAMPQKAINVSTNNLPKVSVEKTAVVNEVAKSENAVLATKASTAVKPAASDGIQPRYIIPYGAFYIGNSIFPFEPTQGLSYNDAEARFVLASPYSAYTWLNASLNGTMEDKYLWSYPDFANSTTELAWSTTEEIDYESLPENAVLTYGEEGSFFTFAPTLKAEGSGATFGEKYGVQYGFDTWGEFQGAETMSPAYNYNYLEYTKQMSYSTGITNFRKEVWVENVKDNNDNKILANADMLGFGAYFQQPDAMYGVQGVTITAASTTFKGNLTVTLRQFDPETQQFTKVLGTGYLTEKEVPTHPKAFVNIYVPLFIEDPDLGNVQTVVNVDCPIMVTVEAEQQDGFNLACSVNNDRESAIPAQTYVIFTDDTRNYFINVDMWRFGDQGDYPYAYTIGLDVTTSYLEELNGDYEFQVSKNGDTKEFEFDALYVFNESNFYGDGLDEWYTVESTYTQGQPQIVKVTVDALPSGMEGRSSKLTVYTYGSEREITITQGTTGIDVVEGAAEVKSVEYFDMLGRKLNAEPENGIYVRKQTLTDGTSKTEKLAK